MKVTAIILAAGSSSRLGQPKQLLHVNNRTLLRNAAETACASRADKVLVVLGFNARRMRGELDGLSVSIVENPDWQSGMGSSIRCGVAALRPHVEGALLMVCDQPRVATAHLNALIDAFGPTCATPIGSFYGGCAGVPALFPRSMFHDLMALRGDTGAKKLLADRAGISIPWPDGEIDIDTELDRSIHL